ncbi:MAG: transposase [Acidobacteriota bacterium]
MTCRTFQSRFLLWPGPLLNEIIVGDLGRAQRLYLIDICAFFFASNHFHLLARVEDSERLTRFMGYFNSKLAREIARSTGWRDKVFSRRYQAILVSDEEEAGSGAWSTSFPMAAKRTWSPAPRIGRESNASPPCSPASRSREPGSIAPRNGRRG